jgi:acyl-CoA thioesterase
MPTSLEALTSTVTRKGDAATFTITDDWLQGRAAFGGLVAALGLLTSRHLVDGSRRLRALQTTFLRPAVPGPLTFEPSLERDGRNLTQMRAIGFQEGKRVATTRAIFGLPLDVEDRLPPPVRPDAPGPETIEPVPFIEGLMPTFVQHFDFRKVSGGRPFSGSSETESVNWLRAKDGQIGVEALSVMFSDAIAPPALALMPGPAKSSTTAWSVSLLEPKGPVDESGWWMIHARLTYLRGGYGHHTTTLWTPEGEVAALSEQTVAVYP